MRSYCYRRNAWMASLPCGESGFLGYLWNKNFRRPPREDATWWEVSLVWNCIPWLAKSHSPSSSPGRGAAGDSAELGAEQGPPSPLVGELIQGSLRPAALRLSVCPLCEVIGCELCGPVQGAMSTPARRVPSEQEAREWLLCSGD